MLLCRNKQMLLQLVFVKVLILSLQLHPADACVRFLCLMSFFKLIFENKITNVITCFCLFFLNWLIFYILG